MADNASLDDELLAAVGRSSGGGGSRKPPFSRSSVKRGRSGESSDEDDYEEGPGEFKADTDEEEEEEEEEEDSETDKLQGTGNRKASGSKMPLKKRIDKDEGLDDGYASDDAPSYGSDLYKDEADKEELSKMTELEREMILLERGEKREDYLARKKAGSRQQKEISINGATSRQKDLQTPPSSSRMRSSTRDSSRSVNKNALNKLISARQQKAHESDQRRNSSTRRPSPPSHRRRPGGDVEASDESQNSDDERDRDHDRRRYSRNTSVNDGGHSDDDQEDHHADITLEDVNSITIKRSKLAKWFLEPFFEEIIAGCFVRVGVGSKDNHNMYRLCQVKNVDARDHDKQYKFENRMTHKWLNLVWGDSEARWQMARISDQAPTVIEFNQWCREVEKSHSRKPSLVDITDKKEAIAKLNTFVYSADLVKKMLHEKKMSLSRPSNVAAEKDRLLKEMAIAESKNDHVDIERIQVRLKELEAYSMQNQNKNAKAMALAEMNKRNRFENFKNASELKPASHARAGEAGYDPFSRRWTRSQNYYDKTSNGEINESLKEGEDASAIAADSGKLIDTKAPFTEDKKLFSLHDFDLPISLAGIQKFGGALGAHLAFIARKQRVEATCGVPVENSDGRRHMLTLTVNDYKRRRGLL